MIRYLPIPGTWSFKTRHRDWYTNDSPLVKYLAARGLHKLAGLDGREFQWDTDLGGYEIWRRLWGAQPDHTDWEVAGRSLFDYLVPPLVPTAQWPANKTHLIAHSHGLQVVLYACAMGLKVNTLVSVSSPPRADMDAIAKQARANIGFWWDIHSDGSDNIQWWGTLADGHVGIVRKHRLADQSMMIPRAGHSKVLHDVALFGNWDGVVDLIKARDGR
jgi:hypothetical protein